MADERAARVARDAAAEVGERTASIVEDQQKKLQEEVKFHGKAKSDGQDPQQPLEVHAGGKIKMKDNSIKGEGKEKVVPNDGGSEHEVTYRCTGNKDSVHCELSD